MCDELEFIGSKKSILIAPAGHGKTSAISRCLKLCPETSCSLVLTHTHAGIASLKSKFSKENISSSKYRLETIDSFARNLVLSFMGSEFENLGDSEDFEIIVEKCTGLLKMPLVNRILSVSYDHVFVDEYQDCTIDQHTMIMTLVDNIPLHILGDPLQSIFVFENKPLVDFDNDLTDFAKFDFLSYPWRWEYTNKALGQALLDIRQLLEIKNSIDLFRFKCIFIEQYPSCSHYDIRYMNWSHCIVKKLDDYCMLILCPSYKEGNILRGTLSERIRLKASFDYEQRFKLIDAIDGRHFYSCAKLIDAYIEKCLGKRKIKKIAHLYDILCELYINKTSLNKWISRSKNQFVNKRQKEDAEIATMIQYLFNRFEKDCTLTNLIDVIKYIIEKCSVKCNYRSIYYEILSAANIAIKESLKLFDALKLEKNKIRQIGRRIEGRCIGTTLLTKGLEFNTVIVLHADRFPDANNSCVAIPRACKRLVLVTDNNVIKF